LNTTVVRGHTAQFQCKVRSTQPPLIRWLKRIDPNSLHHLEESSSSSSQIVNAAGMTLLVLEDQRSSQTVHSGLDPQLYTNRLVIPKADDHHEGVYICVVTNPAGHIAYRAAHLTVLEENALMFAAQNCLPVHRRLRPHLGAGPFNFGSLFSPPASAQENFLEFVVQVSKTWFIHCNHPADSTAAKAATAAIAPVQVAGQEQ